jgi:positive regulator of sigma E activity
MTETAGIVVRLEGEDAWVRAEGQGKACGACAQKDSCTSIGSGGLLGSVPGQDQGAKLLRLPNTIHARPGDAVVIRAAEGVVLRAVWIAYGMPLVLGLLGALASKTWFANELAVFAGMLLGLATGFLALRWRGLDRGDKDPILSIGFKRIP